MSKTLCDWSKKDLEKEAATLAWLTREPRWYCRKCARVANTSKVLCKPRKFPGADPVLEDLIPSCKNKMTRIG